MDNEEYDANYEAYGKELASRLETLVSDMLSLGMKMNLYREDLCATTVANLMNAASYVAIVSGFPEEALIPFITAIYKKVENDYLNTGIAATVAPVSETKH